MFSGKDCRSVAKESRYSEIDTHIDMDRGGKQDTEGWHGEASDLRQDCRESTRKVSLRGERHGQEFNKLSNKDGRRKTKGDNKLSRNDQGSSFQRVTRSGASTASI